MATKHLIHIENTGERYLCAEDENLLRGMEMLGRKGIPVGCRGGGCGVCKVHITAGDYAARKMSKSCVSEEELAQGVVLACRVYPQGEISLDVVGKMAKSVCKGAEAPAPQTTCFD
ncbi:2Fe-2S iron-sulfur cluster-binding protein [Zoogloea sp. 1C4]|uniref:2Fe-2S iron-sulfur cluster-binding protein n=1 Tax=Zoogloea sp. 1C4 TaxID=2570190 RepID=UPI0012926535|nr:2Fe-2S iron-sulfur cluster-binding protein [Zoogloea sp. 1C4]